MSDICGFVDVWRDDGSVVYNCCWSSPAQSFSCPSSVGLMTHILLSQILEPSTLEGQVPVMFIPQKQGGPVTPPGTGFPFRHLLRLAGLRWRYSNPPPCVDVTDWVGRSVKLLLAFASTVIPGFSRLEIHDQDFYTVLDMYVFRSGTSSLTKEESVFLCRRYVCCTVVPARAYPRCHGVQVTMGCASFVTALY
jgi:hypothetical protein